MLVNGTNYPGDAYDTGQTGTVLASTSSVLTTGAPFTDISTTYTTGAIVSGDLTIVLANTTNNGRTPQIGDSFQDFFDNVRLDASNPGVSSVPEPASLALGTIGLFTLAGGSWWRRKRTA